jgi:RNA polymerase sigma-70 factor, ECF subfamily
LSAPNDDSQPAMPKSRRLSDATLVRRSQQGDRRAFSALLGRYDRRLRGLAHALLLDRRQMDAALGLAYLRAWRDVVRVTSRDDIAAWLYRNTYNACVDQLRRGEPRTDGAVGDSVGVALAALPPADRVSVVLVDREGFSPASAARILGLSETALVSRLGVAREHLATELGIRVGTTPEAPAPADGDEPVATPEPVNGDEPVATPAPVDGDEPVESPEPLDGDEPVARPEPVNGDAPAEAPPTASPVVLYDGDGDTELPEAPVAAGDVSPNGDGEAAGVDGDGREPAAASDAAASSDTEALDAEALDAEALEAEAPPETPAEEVAGDGGRAAEVEAPEAVDGGADGDGDGQGNRSGNGQGLNRGKGRRARRRARYTAGRRPLDTTVDPAETTNDDAP